MTRYLITTAITAYQRYTVDAPDEQAARDVVYDAIKTGNEKVLATYGDLGFNDDEEVIDSTELKELVSP